MGAPARGATPVLADIPGAKQWVKPQGTQERNTHAPMPAVASLLAPGKLAEPSHGGTHLVLRVLLAQPGHHMAAYEACPAGDLQQHPVEALSGWMCLAGGH